jgi:hypothetical protein
MIDQCDRFEILVGWNKGITTHDIYILILALISNNGMDHGIINIDFVVLTRNPSS